MLEVTRSLKTGSLLEAHHRVIAYHTRLMEIFEMLRTENYTKERARHVIQACFDDLAQQADHGFTPTSNDPDQELFEQECLADEAIADLTRASFSREFSAGFASKAVGVLAGRGVDVSGLPNTAISDLIDGYTRALAEQQRLFKFRLQDRLGPYTPHDPLFTATSVVVETAPQSVPAALPSGPNLKELVDHYLAEKRTSWTAKRSDHLLRRRSDRQQHHRNPVQERWLLI